MLYENRDGDFGKLQSQYLRFLFEIRLGSRPIYRGQSSLNKILYRRARTLFKIVESETPWHGLMRLEELNQIIPGPPGFDNFEERSSSVLYWARAISGCTHPS